MNNSEFFRLKVNDFIKGLVVVVIGALLGAFQQALETQGLNLSQYDWGSIINLALTAGVAYLAKNLLSDSDGRVMGAI